MSARSPKSDRLHIVVTGRCECAMEIGHINTYAPKRPLRSERRRVAFLVVPYKVTLKSAWRAERGLAAQESPRRCVGRRLRTDSDAALSRPQRVEPNASPLDWAR